MAAWIDRTETLQEFNRRPGRLIGLDTEFMRTDTFAPRLALIQIEVEGAVALVDPTAGLDLAALSTRLGDPQTVSIMHSASEDLDALGPLLPDGLGTLFDTQIAAAFCGLGAGLGYSAAVIARMAEFVVALEEDPELAAEAETRLAAVGADNVAVITGALDEGDAKHGPYDVIFIEGAVQQVPLTILEQIKEGGRIVAIFAGDHLGTVRIGYRIGDDVDWRPVFNAAGTVLPGFAAAPEFAL